VLDFAQYVQKEGYSDSIEELKRLREDVKMEVCSFSWDNREGFNIETVLGNDREEESAVSLMTSSPK